MRSQIVQKQAQRSHQVSRRCKTETSLGTLGMDRVFGYAHGANGRATAISDSRWGVAEPQPQYHRLFHQKHLPIFFFLTLMPKRTILYYKFAK